jgi:hypothetical protein
MGESKLLAPPQSVPKKSGSLGQQPSQPNPFLAFQQTIGNQSMLQLLESGAIQTKLSISQPGDADEIEADRVAETITASPLATLHRKVQQSSASIVQRSPADQSPQSAATQAVRPSAQVKPWALLIVEDDAVRLAPGQMKKSQFIEALRDGVCATADQALAAVGRSAESCPYIEKWLAFYANQDSRHIEQAIQKYAPEAARAGHAREYISFAPISLPRMASPRLISSVRTQTSRKRRGPQGGRF